MSLKVLKSKVKSKNEKLFQVGTFDFRLLTLDLSGGFTPLQERRLKASADAPSKRRGGLVTGFTLIETLIAISIVVLAITGPLFIISKNISASAHARNQATAQFLAQEGMETIRNIRDNDQLNSRRWLASFPTACIIPQDTLPQQDNFCVIDAQTNPPTIEQCPESGCPALKYNPNAADPTNDFLYRQSGAALNLVDSLFTRKFYLTRPNEANPSPPPSERPSTKEIRATVVLEWKNVLLSKELKIEETLFCFYSDPSNPCF